MNARGALHAGDRTPLLDARATPATGTANNTSTTTNAHVPARHARESTRVDRRRLGAIGLLPGDGCRARARHRSLELGARGAAAAPNSPPQCTEGRSRSW